MTANGNATVSVLLGNGDGTFLPKVDYPIASGSYSVAIGDFNADGAADLAAANASLNSVSILLNNGDGTFAPKGDLGTGPFPHFVVTADFDGDGRTDLATADHNGNSVSVLRNTTRNQTGTFTQGVDYSFTRPSPSALKAAGYSFVIRYLGGSASKDITASEAQALKAAGLGIISVFEGTANRMLSGFDAGVTDANIAVAQATAAGAPPNFFCYFACDFDAQPSDQTAIDAYLDGVASALGGVNRVGFYGGYGPLKRVLDAGKAAKGWQTTAWSGGLKDSRVSLYQDAYTLSLPGDPAQTFDRDEGYGNDLGQWFLQPGDANGDGKADFSDLVVLAQNYGIVGGMTLATGDFNGDGNVDFVDLVILAQHYGQTLAASVASPATTAAVRTQSSAAAPAKSLFSVVPVAKPLARKPRAVARAGHR